MSRQDLEDSISRLRTELEALGPDSNEVKVRLSSLTDEMERELLDLDAADQDGLAEKLKHQIEVFEVEHPRITNILNDIMLTLSNLGI